MPFTDPVEGLPVIESCDGCGACCLEQEAPPDYVALRTRPDFAADPSFAEDWQRLQSLPAEALRLLDDFLVRRDAGETESDRTCVWFDPESRGCRFYEWRPSTCRVFELNSMGCRIYRHRNGLGGPGELPAGMSLPAGTPSPPASDAGR